MKKKDVMNLTPGGKVKHSRYGVSTVREVMLSFGSLFGVQIEPQTAEGKSLLRADAGIETDMPFLEDSIRRLSA